MSSGGKGGNGGLRAAEERQGQDMHREEQEGEQAATGLHGWGLCANQKRCLPLGVEAIAGQVTGFTGPSKQGAGWNSASLTSACSEQSAQPYEGSESKSAKKAE